MFNKVILVGTLTRDPDLRIAKDGVTKYAKLHIVTTEFLSGKKHAEFHRIICFNKAYNICPSLFKGRMILVEGPKRERMYKDTNGIDQRECSVHAEKIEFLDYKTRKSEENEEGAEVNPTTLDALQASFNSNLKEE